MKQETKFKQTEIGNIPEGWGVKTFKNVSVDIIDGDRGINYPKKSDFKSEGFCLFLNTKNVPHYRFDFSECDFIDKERDQLLRKGKLQSGDLVLTTRGTIGNIAYFHDEIGFSEIRINSGMVILRNQKKDFETNFLYLMLRSPVIRSQIVSYSTGSAQPQLPIRDINKIKLPIPPMAVQKAIAKILSDLDSKIELLQKQNKTLEAIGQAIFKHWFVDFEFPNEEGKPYKSSGGEMVFNEELEKEIPKGWHIGRLGEIIQNFDSKRVPLSSREREKRRGIYPYYGATKIMDYVDDYLFDGTYLLMAEDGSVIDDEGYPVLQYVWGKFWANNHTHIIKGEGVSTEFVYLLLSKTNIARYVTGAVQPKLNQANMNSMNILIPDNAIIKNFDSTIQIIFTKKKLIFEQIQSLQKTRDLLLPKLMSGKIRVPVEVE